ncbi:glucose-6-phosphate dehydrogenase assembly protein OpcA [Naumannella halotolerans]|uniref:glucose-6-phosphate dehydrogenase assembly protein OpcA n=1 Tax=Naumannella halotolerans TaxID=993414 RepID=UPI00370D57A8
MIIELQQTTASKVAQALLHGRQVAGSRAMGMVMTMVVVCEEKDFPAALDNATQAALEHPARIIFVVRRRGRKAQLNAEVRLGDGSPGEVVIFWVSGPVADHSAGVVLPLLLPDAPVIVWWPGRAPDVPATDQIGQLGTRRITDSATAGELLKRVEQTRTGDSDLAWTRLTTWRALLAAALDQYPAQVTAATVTASRNSASGGLLAAWLRNRLGVPVELRTGGRRGLSDARLVTAAGDVALTRIDESTGTYRVPGQPQREVALRRREVKELLAEELRRLDPDEVYAEVVNTLLELQDSPAATGSGRPATEPVERTARTKAPTRKTAVRKAPAQKTTAKKAPAKKATGKKTAAKKTTAKKAPAKKTPTKRATGSRKTTSAASSTRSRTR